jgi:tetratricopeptide (TPR) repeat protein
MNKEETFKSLLLSISEEIVDIGEVMDATDPDTDPVTIRKSVKRLREIGDELLGLEHDCTGDDLAYVRFMLGSVCQMLGYHDQAADAYYLALERWPDHVGILNELFISLHALGDYEEAYEIINRSIKAGGETPDVLQNLAAVLVLRDRPGEAKAVLFNCISKFPEDAESQAMLKELDERTKRGAL